MNYRNCVSGKPEFVALWNDICDEAEKAEAAWIAKLRADGVIAAHPDDGWVDRKENYLVLCYPQFNDGVEVGSIVALGNADKHRLVTITEHKKNPLAERWYFG